MMFGDLGSFSKPEEPQQKLELLVGTNFALAWASYFFASYD